MSLLLSQPCSSVWTRLSTARPTPPRLPTTWALAPAMPPPALRRPSQQQQKRLPPALREKCASPRASATRFRGRNAARPAQPPLPTNSVTRSALRPTSWLSPSATPHHATPPMWQPPRHSCRCSPLLSRWPESRTLTSHVARKMQDDWGWKICYDLCQVIWEISIRLIR